MKETLLHQHVSHGFEITSPIVSAVHVSKGGIMSPITDVNAYMDDDFKYTCYTVITFFLNLVFCSMLNEQRS